MGKEEISHHTHNISLSTLRSFLNGLDTFLNCLEISVLSRLLAYYDLFHN